MISTLLWRCPICKTPDVIKHEKRRWRPDLVSCSACHTQWELSRDFGGPDYLMKATSGENTGQCLPVAQWYDQMMAGLALDPVETPDWPIQGVSQPGETLYLFGTAAAFTFPGDPVFQDERFTPINVAPLQNGMLPVGPGRLALTSARLLYITKQGAVISLPWESLSAADTLMDIVFIIRSGERFFFFMLAGQSVLKWLAHAHLIVEQLNGLEHHKIYLGFL